jgi:hypothetical protein
MKASENWEELLDQLDDDDSGPGEVEWGENLTLEPGGDTFVGWYRSTVSWNGRYGETPVYLLRDQDDRDVFLWGGRAQLDRKMANAAPQPGDKIAIRRLEDAPAEEGRSPAWRVRVAIAPGEGTMPGEPNVGGSVVDNDDLPY